MFEKPIGLIDDKQEYIIDGKQEYIMISILLAILLVISSQQAPISQDVDFVVIDAETKTPLHGATVFIQSHDLGTATSVNGLARFESLAHGTYTFLISYIGYTSVTLTLSIPYTGDQPIPIAMEHAHSDLEEIIISSVRTSRTIDNTPTRVEAITLEEIQEKANMRPGDIRMILAESTGIQVVQTSAISGSANFRIQGLDGRYTQLLKDGFPLYTGFSGGLSIMQIPPLDLQQVEVIKGANSTLYGGDAIAGLVNLISKTPSSERELSFLANMSSSKTRDLSAYYSGMSGKVGFTLFTAYNQSLGYDPSDQGFAAVPKYDRYTVHPRIFLKIDQNTDLMLGGQWSIENRLGGDIRRIRDGSVQGVYFEQHDSQRQSSQISLTHRIGNILKLNLKNSITRFDRTINITDYIFDGSQTATFSEFTLQNETGSVSWIGGLNLWTDRFEDKTRWQLTSRDFRKDIIGGFAQLTTPLSDHLTVESGLRIDYASPATQNKYKGWFVLPRISLLYQLSHELTLRTGGGFGYKYPDFFTDEAENRAFFLVMPPDMDYLKAEQSRGLNLDVNYRTVLAHDWVLRVNQLFYYTHLQDPLTLTMFNNSVLFLRNLDGHVRTRGTETNITLIYDHAKLFLGYTWVDAITKSGGTTEQVPLNAPHQLSAVIMLEEHDSYRLGFELYYFSKQPLSDGTHGRSYVIMGLMGEKSWGRLTLFANLENMLDTRQTRFGPIYYGTRTRPNFAEIFAPLEGRYFNAGMRIRL